MTKRLVGKVAVITGGGNGIGKETALLMANEGAKVVVADMGKDPDGTYSPDKVVNEIKNAGGAALANYDSVITMQGGQNIINTALQGFGRIDILVNSAGNYIPAPTVEFTEEQWDAIINVHEKGLFACTQPAIKEMIKQKSGRIINITSIGAFPPGMGNVRPRSIAYATAKAGVMGFTAMLSIEMKDYNITVNAISPNAVTKLFPQTGDRWAGGKREGPEYVAPVIAYLATDEAKDITGQFIYVGGSDIGIYSKPFQLPGPHMFVRKTIGKWTVDELVETMPQIVNAK